MKVSQIETLYKITVLFLVSFTSICVAAPQGGLSSLRIDPKLKPSAVLSDKKGPSLSALTGDSKSFQGGTSDGGGNAVGESLFDFYENQGTTEVTIAKLISLEPSLQPLLRSLNAAVPAIGSLSSGGFGDILVGSLGAKKIYLESKLMNSSECLNQSVVASAQQKVVACQNDLEVRFDIHWLKPGDENHAGLIAHEMLLAWARSLGLPDSKKVLEQKVRIVNRAIFQNQGGLDDLLKEYFSVRAFSAAKYQSAKELAARVSDFQSRHPEASQGQLLQNLLSGVQTGAVSYDSCKFFVENLKGTLSRDLYQTLEAAHLTDVSQMCIAD